MNEQKLCYALTHPQQRVWYTEKLYPGTGMWNNAGTLKIKGELDFKLLERAINLFVNYNESIRLRVGEKNGTPYQYIAAHKEQTIDLVDFSGRDKSSLYAWDSAQTQAPMPLIDTDLYYFALIKLGDKEGGIYAKFHHIISDGLSILEFCNQVVDSYSNLLDGSEIEVPENRSYIEYIHAEEDYLNSKRFTYDQKYWSRRFAQLPEPTVIKQKKTNYFGAKARRKAYVIPDGLSSHIRKYCENTEVSVFSLFLSALAIYINRITNKKDITIGAPVVNRTSLNAKGAFGMFVSTVPIRIDINDDLSFTEFSQVVSNEWFSALKHQKYPYDILMQDLRSTHKQLESLYDVTLSYQIGKFEKNSEKFTYEGRWHFSGFQPNSLSIHVNDREDDGKFIVDYDYQSPFFSTKEIEYIHAHILSIIKDMTQHPDKPLYQLELLADEERHRIIHRFNDTDHAFPEGETLGDLWYRRMRQTPSDDVAVICGGQSITYGQLDERSTALAHHLKKQGVGVDDVVGLLVPRTLDYCIGVLAILKAGAAFLPIASELPTERIAYMLGDSGAKVLLVAPSLMDKCTDTSGCNVIRTDIALDAQEDTDLESVCSPDNLAYVIYTSGSTGQPKGVQIEHHSIVHFVYSLSEIWDFAPGARLLCAASISFDISVMELLLSLLKGAVLVLAKEDEVNIPRNMVRLINTTKVNMLVVTPGRMELLLSDKQGEACIKDFREIGMGGDVLPEKLLAKVQLCTKARITNFYGPTEITVCATCTDVTQAKIPNIGRPMHNVKAYILDAHKNPVPIGVPGELYLGGNGVARGYINKPELNQERFIDSPFLEGQKLYRTGDLTRWYPLGEIEFLGRIDKQVKIRGYRIELGEIENRLMRVTGVTACVVTDREDDTGRRFLCAYLCGNPPKKADIKAHLVKELPAYMIPSYFVTVEHMPFNESGKVDRNLLPDPLVSEAFSEDYIAPETETQKALAKIWRNVLNIEHISRDDSFFDIGGDSLSIVRVMAQVLQEFHVDIMLEKVYRSPRLKDFAALIDEAEQGAYRPIETAPDMPDYPVSSAQQRMWVLAQRDKASTAYNVPVVFSLEGQLDIDRLRLAFTKLMARHEALRTVFILREGQLRQKILKEISIDIAYRRCAVVNLKSVLKDLIKPFDMEAAPLLRATIIVTGKEKYILFIDMHHIIGDRRSVDILMSELVSIYSGIALANKKFEYKDYAVWQQEFLGSKSISLQKEYWQSVLDGELPLLNLHTDSPRGAVQSFEGERLRFKIDRGTTDKLRTFANQHGGTLFMMVLAVYNVLLTKYTGQEDIIVGTPVSGRNRQETQDIVGVFINTLPLRNYPRGDISFKQFFEELCQNSISSFAHSDYPLERIVADLALPRDTSRNPLFDTMFVHGEVPNEFELEDVKVGHYLFDPGIAKLDITLEAYESDDGMLCQFEYNTKLFDKTKIKRMSKHLNRLFVLLMDTPDTRLADVTMLSRREIWQVTQGFNQTDMPLNDQKTIQSIFEDLAVSQGKKTAVIINGKKMTFAALNNRANQIAHRLREKGVGRNTIVALCIKRSFDMVAGLLGILKAGGGYLPLDPSYPKNRISFMLADSDTKILLTDGTSDISHNGDTLYINDVLRSGISNNLEAIDQMDDAAYVIYTSGSTGTPKGAILPRRALYNLYEGAKTTIAYEKEHSSVSVTTVSFDIFVVDALLPLLSGCTVAVCTEEELRQPHLLAALIERNDVKFIQTTPTRMRIMMEDPSFRAAAAKHIKKIVLGGEEFPLSLLKLLKKYTEAQIISGYGPTETTVYCTFKDLTHTSHITIGRPIVNTRMYILDKYKRPVPFGVFGEAYISGACVTTGYINRDALNREKLVPDPYWPGHTMYQSGDICAFMENGEMEIAGRVDHQVKIRGLRIELGEIEAAMREINGVDEAVVKALGHGVEKYLCAYYAMRQEISEEAMREHLGAKLPSYMVPSYFVGMKDMPLTLNGKVDRKALREPDMRHTGKKHKVHTGQLTDIEKKMADVWSTILKVDIVGPDANFFSLGGDSLSVIKVQAAILQYGWSIRTQDFYDYQTLHAICDSMSMEGKAIRKLHSLEEKLDVPVERLRHLKQIAFNNILLTGATGYLGAHILEKLAYMPKTHILCLVRGKDDKACENYLMDILVFYFGMNKCKQIMQRVTVMRGNISENNLGVDESIYNELSNVDTIIHSAAITDHVGQAEAFYQTNVVGTKNIVQLAAWAQATLLHISTVSVSGTHYVDDPYQVGEFTENNFYVGQNYSENEYAKSKFFAEEIVLDEIQKGLNARIYRVGVLTSTVDGIFQLRPQKNAFANRIKALCEMGFAPMGMLDTRIEMTPVDECVNAIFALAMLKKENLPIYHVYNTNTLNVGELISLLEQNGNAIEIITDEEFRNRVTEMSQRGNYNELAGLMEDINASSKENIFVTADATMDKLVQAGFSWSQIDAAYLEKFMACIDNPYTNRERRV